MPSAAAVQPPTHTVAGIEQCLALDGIPLDRLLSDAKVPRSTWSTWRAGRARPRLERWASVTAAFDALVAEAAPAAVVEPVVLTGCSSSTGAPPSFTPIATAAPAEPPAAAAEPIPLTGSSPPTGAPPSFTPIATAAPAADLTADCDRARVLIGQSQDSLRRFARTSGDDSRERQDLLRANALRDAAVADLAARPATTPRDLAAKASVVLAGLGDRPAEWLDEVPDYIALVRSLAVDAARISGTAAGIGPACDGRPTAAAARNLSTLAGLNEEMDRLSRAANDCCERTVYPPVPEALFRRAEDGIWSLSIVSHHACGRRWYAPDCIAALRAWPSAGHLVDPGERHKRRRDEIVAAYDDWRVRMDAARAVSGLDVAEAALTACSKRLNAFRNAILDLPAESFGDVLAKAAVVSWWWVDEEEDSAAAFAADRARLMENGRGDHLSAMAAAILSDLARMAVARGLTLDRSAPPGHAGAAEASIAAAAA